MKLFEQPAGKYPANNPPANHPPIPIPSTNTPHPTTTPRFTGWYFKHQQGNVVVAFIPGRAQGGAFVQMLSPAGARQFDLPSLRVARGFIRVGGCMFSRYGCKIDLLGVQGALRYGPLTPLASDIMGPFRFFPMECRHGVISMAHTLQGYLVIEGRRYCFDGGNGYIEMDSGTSFPRFYQWLQCNDFAQPCAFVLSLAHIPFYGLQFTGCICALVYRGRQYRLATYRGVRILAAGAQHITLRQGALRLAVAVTPAQPGQRLRAPVRGRMAGGIRESVNAHLRLRLWEGGRPVFDLQSPHAMYEYVPAVEPWNEKT
ncbi:MAG: tocopherol cyclase family protein [Gemmiger sp.]|nr:tocopherol cyclase family protein [Gemmiger sp.]